MKMKSSHPLEQEELMAYLDGELRPELAAAAAAHLDNCAECRATAADLRELSQQLAAWEIEMGSTDVPAAVSSAVDAHARARKTQTAAHRRTWRQVLGARRLIWAGGALALVTLIAISLPNLFVAHKAVMPAEAKRSVAFISDGVVPLATPQREGRGASGGVGNGTIRKLKVQDSITGVNGAIGNTDGQPAPDEEKEPVASNGPMIVRTAQLSLTTKEFDKARASAEEILKRHGGYIGELNVNAPAGSGRTLNATFRVPASQLDAAMAELKKLGRVTFESQGGEEVTQQYVDLQARLANARHTEQRLSDLLRDRTGKLSDVLAFEKEIDRVRGEIESMEAQRKSLARQVSYATLSATMTEDYSQQLQVVPPSTSTQFRNAAIDGYRTVADGIVSLLLFLLSAGPSILIWGGILFLVARMIWKRLRRRIA